MLVKATGSYLCLAIIRSPVISADCGGNTGGPGCEGCPQSWATLPRCSEYFLPWNTPSARFSDQSPVKRGSGQHFVPVRAAHEPRISFGEAQGWICFGEAQACHCQLFGNSRIRWLAGRVRARATHPSPLCILSSSWNRGSSRIGSHSGSSLRVASEIHPGVVIAFSIVLTAR